MSFGQARLGCVILLVGININGKPFENLSGHW
jgi:hypothetical protein